MGDLTVRAILGYAIEKEMEAQQRYAKMAQVSEREKTRKLFERLVETEKEHEAKLRAMTEMNVAMYKLDKTPGLHVAEELGEVEFGPGMKLLDAIGLAVKHEEASVNLYREAARQIPEGPDSKVFDVLAQEEEQHKFELEMEYRELESDYNWNVKKEE